MKNVYSWLVKNITIVEDAVYNRDFKPILNIKICVGLFVFDTPNIYKNNNIIQRITK